MTAPGFASEPYSFDLCNNQRTMHRQSAQFPGFLSLLFLLLIAALPAAAQPPSQVTCTSTAFTRQYRYVNQAERVADLVVQCTGGLPTAAGQAIPQVTWKLTFDAEVTSRTLAPGWSEALLLIDEPQPEKQLACATDDGICTMTGTGNGVGAFSGATGRPNIFQGAFTSDKTVLTWTAPFDPPGSTVKRTFRFTNLRLDSNTVTSPLGDLTVVASTSGPVPITFDTSNRTLGTYGPPFLGDSASSEESKGRLSRFLLTIKEGAPDYFRPFSSAGPSPGPAQAVPGAVPFDYETGFYNPSLPATARGNLAQAGLPDSGTRIRIVMTEIPTSTILSVPLTISFGFGGTAQLVTADANGAGPYTPAPSGTLNNVNGMVSGTYEILTGSPVSADTFTIPVSVTYSPAAGLYDRLRGYLAPAPWSTASPKPVPSSLTSAALGFIIVAPRNPMSILNTSLPPGMVGVPYQAILEPTGGRAPYSFVASVDPPGATNATGVPGVGNFAGTLRGTPTTAGTYKFAITATSAFEPGGPAPAQARREFTLNILQSGAPLPVSASKLDFTAVLNGGPPPAQTFRIGTQPAVQVYSIVTDSLPGSSTVPSWLQVSPPSGAVPALITASINPTGLAEGTYNARIQVLQQGTTNLPPAIIPVTLVVKAGAAKLESSVPTLELQTWTAAPETPRALIVLRNGGGGNPIAVTASVLQSSPWITSVTPNSGSASSTGLPVTVNINSAGLAEGIYRDVIRFASATGTVEAPVILRVAAPGSLLGVNVTGARFASTVGSASATAREVRILNREPGSSLSWNAELIRGSEYFALSAASGVATQATPGTIKLSARPATASLAAGTYHGLVRLTAAGSSPRYVVAVLQVKTPGTPLLDLDPGGLMFTGTAGAQQTSSRTVALTASSAAALPYQAAVSMIDGAGWLTATPASGTDARTDTLTVTVDPRNLTAGIYRGEITIAGPDASQTLSVNYVVRAATCTPDRLAIVSTSLANDFTVPVGLPAPLTVEVRDNCGGAVSNATVTARFSNGDAPLLLISDSSAGAYSATWQPGSRLDQTNVTFLALRSDLLEARATLVGSVTDNKVPTLSRGGTIHNLDPKVSGLLSPGVVAQVYGSDLAGAAESTSAIPLSTTFKGTSVLVGANEAPLYFVSPGQLVVQLPNELTPNRSYPVVVTANGAITIPDQIDVVPAQPGVAAFADGKIIAQHSDFKLVDAANPAKRGEYLVMYLVGMGASDQTVASGVPSPSTAPLPALKIQPTVTVDGNPAQVVFSGLTPGGIGLYQINFKVPDNARLNAPLDVLVKQGPHTANVTTLTVAP